MNVRPFWTYNTHLVHYMVDANSTMSMQTCIDIILAMKCRQMGMTIILCVYSQHLWKLWTLVAQTSYWQTCNYTGNVWDNIFHPLILASQEQVVPGANKDGDEDIQRKLPTTTKEGAKLLELFQGDDIFASREEWNVENCFNRWKYISYHIFWCQNHVHVYTSVVYHSPVLFTTIIVTVFMLQ